MIWQIERGILEGEEGPIDQIEELIYSYSGGFDAKERSEHLCIVLRLLCLLSLSAGRCEVCCWLKSE